MDQRSAEDEIELMIHSIKKTSMKKWFDNYTKDEKKTKKKMKVEMEQLSAVISNYELEYAEDGKNAKAQKKLMGYQKTFKEIESEVKEFIIKHTEKHDEPMGLKPPKKKRAEGQELIQMGDKMLDDGFGRLEGMERNLNDGYQMVIDGNLELERQHEKLLEAGEHVQDMKSSLKKAQEHIRYFSEAFYKDKFFRVMTILILITFVTIVIIAFVKKKKTTTTTDTTNTTSTTNNTTSLVDGQASSMLLTESVKMAEKYFNSLNSNMGM